MTTRQAMAPNDTAASDVSICIVGLSIEAACHAAGDISRSQLFKEIAAGRLKSKMVGKRRLIPVQSLRDWLAAMPDGSAAKLVSGEDAGK